MAGFYIYWLLGADGAIYTSMSNQFEVVSPFEPSGDQPEAIRQLCDGLRRGERNQVLLGVTGSGKTFTMANIIHISALFPLCFSLCHFDCSPGWHCLRLMQCSFAALLPQSSQPSWPSNFPSIMEIIRASAVFSLPSLFSIWEAASHIRHFPRVSIAYRKPHHTCLP